jgi:hypothetical protein
MKIAHEAPKSIFAHVQRKTDYDYALVHLFETDPIYYRLFKDAVIQGREVILDNSIFELGTAFSGDGYYKWINELQPTWYIIPDVLGNADATLKSMDNWLSTYKVEGVKSIGVAQGDSFDEVARCYLEIAPKVDKIAISFDYQFFVSGINNKYVDYMVGRISLVKRLMDEKIIDVNKPHHLLGCGLPQEFQFYRDMGYKFIDSIDTSNPVVHGLNGIRYSNTGLTDKIPTKLIEYMDEEVTSEQLADIDYNIDMFRLFCT